MECRFEKGEGSSATRLFNEQVNKVLVAIIVVANNNEANVTQHVIGYFHQAMQILQTLTNAIIEMNIPQEETMKRVVEVKIGTNVQLVQILPHAATTRD